jgi:hypothetical protein
MTGWGRDTMGGFLGCCRGWPWHLLFCLRSSKSKFGSWWNDCSLGVDWEGVHKYAVFLTVASCRMVYWWVQLCGFLGVLRTPTQGSSCYGMMEESREKYPSLYYLHAVLDTMWWGFSLCIVYYRNIVCRALICWFIDCLCCTCGLSVLDLICSPQEPTGQWLGAQTVDGGMKVRAPGFYI